MRSGDAKQPSDLATIQALRGDLALQIARHVARGGANQLVAAKQLQIPQPTLSKIVNGRVSEVSLELLIRIAVRAGLPVVLQTGRVPEEAGAFVSVPRASGPARQPSRLADQARDDLATSVRRLTPEQRLDAHLKHTELVTALHRGAQSRRGGSR
jgi:predicted XRE-type DNA-binding protein